MNASNISLSNEDLTTTPGSLPPTFYQYPIVEIPILLIIIVIGVIGNAFIIGAVLVEKTLRNMGVALIINLAVADLVITAWYLPQVLANVINGYNNSLLGAMWFCKITGFMVSWCCQVSMLTLMFIALARYWKLTRHSTYNKWFGQRQTLLIILFIWVESFLVALPLIIGWGGSGSLLGFDDDIVSCMWNDDKAPAYNAFLVAFAIFLPLIATVYLYVQIYRHVQKRRLPPRKEVSPVAHRKNYHEKQMQVSVAADSELSSTTADTTQSNLRTHHARHNSLTNHKVARNRRQEERERNLLVALLVVVVFFLLFWTPYAIAILLTFDIPVIAKRACGWLALSNSAVNSIIYGVLNRHFRRGYKKLLKQIAAPFFCLRGCVCGNTPHWLKCLPSTRVEKDSQGGGQEYKQHSVTFN